eukprot:scaffold142750_cov59-Attheya_sp.AAC.4
MEVRCVEDPANDLGSLADTFSQVMSSNVLDGLAGSFYQVMSPQPDDLTRAVMNNDRTGAFELLQDGADPFCSPFRTIGYYINGEESTAFHKASRRHDLELLLHMAAEPGTIWTKRFLLCCDKVVDVPTQGRACISSMSRSFFCDGYDATMEGLEVMMMYGYKLKERELMGVFYNVATNAECLRLVKFCLAVGLFDEDDNADSFKLERGLGLAIGGIQWCFFRGFHAPSIELARILLSAGANPNGCCFQVKIPTTDVWPALFQAIMNRDEEMTRLLVEYGADVTASAYERRRVSGHNTNRLVNCIEEMSIVPLATAANMLELLDPPTTLADVNKKKYVKALRRELAGPLKMLVANQSTIVIVAMMRSTGQVPPLGLITQSILEYCPLGFDFWKL